MTWVEDPHLLGGSSSFSMRICGLSGGSPSPGRIFVLQYRGSSSCNMEDLQPERRTIPLRLGTCYITVTDRVIRTHIEERRSLI